MRVIGKYLKNDLSEDFISFMQWQTKEAAKAKDRVE